MGLPDMMIARRRGAFALLVANGFGQAAVSLGLVVLVREATSEVSASAGSGVLAAAAVCLGLLLFGLRILQKRQGDAMALGYTAEIRVRLVEQLLSLPADAGKARLGLVMTRLITDLAAIKNWLADGLAALFVSLPTVCGIVLGAFVLAPSVAPLLLAGILVWTGATLISIPFLRGAIRESRKRRGRMSARLGDIVLSRTTLAHFGRSGPTTRKVERMSQTLNAALVTRAGWSGTARAASDLVLPVIVAALVSIMLLGMPRIAPADLSVLLLLAGLVVTHLADLARAADYRLAYREARRRLSDILAEPVPGEPEHPVALPRTDAGRAIRVAVEDRNGGMPRLFEAPAGALVFVDGGESSLRSVFLQAVAGQSGRLDLDIRLDSVAIAETSLRDRRRAITLVSPDMPLVRASLLDNVSIGAPDASTHWDVARVADLCGIDLAGLQDPTPVDPSRADPRLATAMRAARGLIRRAAIIVIDDPDLTGDVRLCRAVCEEARLQRATVILAAQPGIARDADVVWDISGLVLGPDGQDVSADRTGDDE